MRQHRKNRNHPSIFETLGTFTLLFALMTCLACIFANPVMDRLDVLNYEHFRMDQTRFYALTGLAAFILISSIAGLFLWIDHRLYPHRPEWEKPAEPEND